MGLGSEEVLRRSENQRQISWPYADDKTGGWPGQDWLVKQSPPGVLSFFSHTVSSGLQHVQACPSKCPLANPVLSESMPD